MDQLIDSQVRGKYPVVRLPTRTLFTFPPTECSPPSQQVIFSSPLEQLLCAVSTSKGLEAARPIASFRSAKILDQRKSEKARCRSTWMFKGRHDTWERAAVPLSRFYDRSVRKCRLYLISSIYRMASVEGPFFRRFYRLRRSHLSAHLGWWGKVWLIL